MMKLPVGFDPAEADKAADQWRQVTTAGPTASATKSAELRYAGPIAQAAASGTGAGELPYVGPKAAAAANAGLPAKLAEKGFRLSDSGGLEPIPGGEADPTYVGAKVAADARAKAQVDIDKAGPIAKAQAPYHIDRSPPGSIMFNGLGQMVGSTPKESDEVITSGPNRGMRITVLRSPVDNSIIGQSPEQARAIESLGTQPTGAAPAASAAPGPGRVPAPPSVPSTTPAPVPPPPAAPSVPAVPAVSNPNALGQEGVPSGALVKSLPPQQEGRLVAQGGVESDDIKHDRKIVEKDLEHVLDNAQPQQQQLLALRGLAPEAYTGSGGQFRAEVRNFFQTYMPAGLSGLAPDAAPAQEFNKFALMQAGKQERGDLGSKGGFRALEMYQDANPNLDMQEAANGHMANALLISTQRGVDYAHGATDHYLRNRQGFMDPNNPQPYTPIAAYDDKFTQVFKPELYYSAIQAINGKPDTEWNKGLTPAQTQIVGGIVRRADPGATVFMGGKQVPVSAFQHVIDPTELMQMPIGTKGKLPQDAQQ
jgi:hypothetical protein